MRIELILQVYSQYIQIEMTKLCAEFSETWDTARLEAGVSRLTDALAACLLAVAINEILARAAFLERLKAMGSKLGMRFKAYRLLWVRLQNGIEIEIRTPYFLKAKRGRKKKGPNGRGKHLGLEVMGIMGQATPGCLSLVAQMGLLCPSFAVAQAVLDEQGFKIDVKTIRRYCQVLGETGMQWRGQVSLDGRENLAGNTLVIGIDGGRLRTRRRKRGRRKAAQKRQGFHTDWKEPKLFTIYLVDPAGEIIRDFSPLHDATMGDHHDALALLEQYLAALPLADAARIVFCGDGARWIWTDITALCVRMQLDLAQIHQVLDYTHAKQQLESLLDAVATGKRQQQQLDKAWLALLWHGQIDTLKTEIERVCTGRKLQAALKKWHSYFAENQHRMQYQTFQAAGLPCGSGCVESAIRRVINLRLKAPGTFWTNHMAEVFLFLRSQLLSGRWAIMLHNIVRQAARFLRRIHDHTSCVAAFQPSRLGLAVTA